MFPRSREDKIDVGVDATDRLGSAGRCALDSVARVEAVTRREVRLTRILLAHDRAEGSDVTSRFRALREAASGRLGGAGCPHEPGAVTRDLRVGFLGKAETGRPAIFFSKMPSAATSLSRRTSAAAPPGAHPLRRRDDAGAPSPSRGMPPRECLRAAASSPSRLARRAAIRGSGPRAPSPIGRVGGFPYLSATAAAPRGRAPPLRPHDRHGARAVARCGAQG